MPMRPTRPPHRRDMSSTSDVRTATGAGRRRATSATVASTAYSCPRRPAVLSSFAASSAACSVSGSTFTLDRIQHGRGTFTREWLTSTIVLALMGRSDPISWKTFACAETGRDVQELDKIMLTGFTPEGRAPLSSVDAFVDFAGRYTDAGVTELVIHWPIPDSDFAVDQAVFEKIATESAAQLR
jgi:hypothetical protein